MMTRKLYENSLKFKVLEKIRQVPGNIVLRKDIQDMASPRQISRCLKDLIQMGKLIKIGYGIYAKACISKYLKGPVIEAGFEQACKEALNRLGVKWERGTAEMKYNAGLSTQVPVRTFVQLKSRFRGKLAYNGQKIIMEKGINAK